MQFLFLCVTTVLCLSFVEALKDNDTGVCVVSKSFKKTRLKSYKVRTKDICGKKRCIIKKYRKEIYIETQNQTVCCSGWSYVSGTDSCGPRCSTGCIGGRCIKPELCQCDPPAILDERNKNTCIIPTCDPPCHNGQCMPNNTCSCFEYFEKVNGVCELKCGEGYSRKDGRCQAQCQGCDFGFCDKPGTCVCNAGYKRNSDVCCPENCTSCDARGICQDRFCGTNLQAPDDS